MSKPKQATVKISDQSLDSVRCHVATTRQTISGFVEIAIAEKLANDAGPVTGRQGVDFNSLVFVPSIENNI